MTGRTNSTTLSTNRTHGPKSPIIVQKQTRKRTNSSNTSGSAAKENAMVHVRTKDFKDAQCNFDLKEALDSARKSFERGLRSNTSKRIKRPRSSLHNPSSYSPGVSTRSSCSNLTSNLSPNSSGSNKKSSSAPASPVKACRSPNSSFLRNSPPSNKRVKVQDENKSISKKLILRSDLLLIKADDPKVKKGIVSLDSPVTSIAMESSDVIVKLPSPPIHSVRRYSPKYSDSSSSSMSSVTSSLMPLAADNKLSLCNKLDSTLDTSFSYNNPSNRRMNSSSKSSLLPKSPTAKTLVPKSPNRMLLSDSKRKSTNLNKNKPVSMNEVIKLHQDEGVMHLLHGLPSSRRARAVSATVVRRRASNEFSQAAILQKAQAQAAQGRHHADFSENNKANSLGSIPGLVRKSIVAGYGPQELRSRPRQHCQENSLFRPLSHIKPCTQDELMSPENLEILKQLPTRDYMRLWSSPTRYVLRDQQEHSEIKTSATSMVPNTRNDILNIPVAAQQSAPSSASLSGKWIYNRFPTAIFEKIL